MKLGKTGPSRISDDIAGHVTPNSQRTKRTLARLTPRRRIRDEIAMEAAASLPLAASRFLSPPTTAASCSSRPRSLPFVRAAPQTLKAREAPKPHRPSPRCNAVAEVKAAPDPVAALTRYTNPQPYCSCLIIAKHSFSVVVAIPQSTAQLLWIISPLAYDEQEKWDVRIGSLPILAFVCRFEDVLQTQDCNIILRHYGETRRWDVLSKVFGWMQEHDMLNIASYSSYFKYLGLSRNPARALQVYGAIQDQSTRVHVSVCKAASRTTGQRPQKNH